MLGVLGADAADAFGFFLIERHAIARASDRAILPVDIDHDVFLILAAMLLGGGGKGGLDGLEDDLFVDVFVAMNRIDKSQKFAGVHSSTIPAPEVLLVPNCQIVRIVNARTARVER